MDPQADRRSATRRSPTGSASKLVELLGEEKGKAVKYAEAFEVCEYGSQPTKEELARIFPFVGKGDKARCGETYNNHRCAQMNTDNTKTIHRTTLARAEPGPTGETSLEIFFYLCLSACICG